MLHDLKVWGGKLFASLVENLTFLENELIWFILKCLVLYYTCQSWFGGFEIFPLTTALTSFNKWKELLPPVIFLGLQVQYSAYTFVVNWSYLFCWSASSIDHFVKWTSERLALLPCLKVTTVL